MHNKAFLLHDKSIRRRIYELPLTGGSYGQMVDGHTDILVAGDRRVVRGMLRFADVAGS
jgi:hypothetical protein